MFSYINLVKLVLAKNLSETSALMKIQNMDFELLANFWGKDKK